MEGIEVLTQTEKILRARRMMIELILAMCPGDKLIQDMAKEMGVHEVRFDKEDKDCILCGLCARVCDEVVGAHAIQFSYRGDRREMGAPFREEAMNCIACGACVVVCPVDVIRMEEKEDERTIIRWKRTLRRKNVKYVGTISLPGSSWRSLGSGRNSRRTFLISVIPVGEKEEQWMTPPEIFTFISVTIFVGILLIAYISTSKKGALEWE